MRDKKLIIPMAGAGKRFVDARYTLPKQFLRLFGKTTLQCSLDSLNLEMYDEIVIVCREEFDRQYNVKAFLESVYDGCKFTIIKLSAHTRGSLETVMVCLRALLADGSEDFQADIFTLDVAFGSNICTIPIDGDADLLLIKTNNKGFSYVSTDDGSITGTVVKAAEKIVISDFGAVGLYRFKSAVRLLEFSEQELTESPNFGGEYYICPIFNRYISAGLQVKGVPSDWTLMFGTPSEYEFCKTIKLGFTDCKRIAVASDHSGYEAKTSFSEIAKGLGFVIDDFGCHTTAPCDYSDFVVPAVESVMRNENDFSVCFCESGQGVNIAASSVNGCRSVVVFDFNEPLARAARHNAPNNFSIPAELYSAESAQKLLSTIINSRFEGGRHQDRLVKVEGRE